MIYKHWIDQYETELSWIRQICQELQEMEAARPWAKLKDSPLLTGFSSGEGLGVGSYTPTYREQMRTVINEVFG